MYVDHTSAIRDQWAFPDVAVFIICVPILMV